MLRRDRKPFIILCSFFIKMRWKSLLLASIAFLLALRLAFHMQHMWVLLQRIKGAGQMRRWFNVQHHWLTPFRTPEARRRYALKLSIVTALYALFTYIGLNWATVSGAGSPVWPASGVGMAGLLLGGLELWPAILIGRVIGGIIAGSGQPMWADAMVGFANSLGTIAPILLMRRLGGLDTRLASVTDVARYLFAGAALGAIISASIGTITMIFSVGLSGPRVPVLFLNWAVGNFVGAVTVAPLILSWFNRGRRFTPGQQLHFLGLMVVTTLVAIQVFYGSGSGAVGIWHLLPVLVWAALAFEVRGASAVLVIITSIAVWATSASIGPFVEMIASPDRRIPQLQQFIAVSAFTTLFLATIADERRAKEAMRNREERLSAAISASGAGTFRWRVEGDGLECDTALARLLGFPPSRGPRRLPDLIAQFHKDDRHLALSAFEACVRRGSEFALTARIGLQNGPIRIVQGRGQLVEDHQGGPDYVTGAFVDVTERTRLESRLLKAEETYRAVFEQAGVGVARLAVDGSFLEVNERYSQIIGLSLRQLLGSNWHNLSLAEGEDANSFAAFQKGGSIQKRYCLPDQQVVWVEESLTLVRRDDGDPAFYVAVMQDITERKKAEDDVRLRAQELEVVLGAVPAAIWFAHDPDCTEVTGNSFASDILRLSNPVANMSKTAADTTNVDHFTVFDTKGEEILPQDLPVQRAARGEEVRNFEEYIRFQDGSSVSLLGNATPLFDKQGQVRGSVAAFIDISDRKRAEARERLLSREVDHRAKNVLAVVQAIVQLTQATSTDGFRKTLAGRIQSLARTHSLLAENRWEGVELRRLLHDELAPFGSGDSLSTGALRFTIKGPEVMLKPAAAQALALVFHELATNAVKYGALSVPEGRIAVRWSLTGKGEAARLTLIWEESDGPDVQPPAQSGFGWTVIHASVEEQLDGTMSTDWRSSGLSVEMGFPLDEVKTNMATQSVE